MGAWSGGNERLGYLVGCGRCGRGRARVVRQPRHGASSGWRSQRAARRRPGVVDRAGGTHRLGHHHSLALQRSLPSDEENVMGVEDRDWNRDEPKRRSAVSLSPIGGVLIVVGVIAGLLLAGALQAKTKGSAATYGGEQSSHQGATKISLLPGLPGISLGGDGLYAKNDPWLGYLADEETCPGGENVDAPLADQANTMVCLVNYARHRRRLQPVATVAVLNQSSLAKANRIVRCLDFNHNPCGEAPEADIRALGYNGAWGENLSSPADRTAPRDRHSTAGSTRRGTGPISS